MVLANQEVMVKYCPRCKEMNTFHKQEYDASKAESEMYSCNGCGMDFSRNYIISYDSRRRLEGYGKRLRG